MLRYNMTCRSGLRIGWRRQGVTVMADRLLNHLRLFAPLGPADKVLLASAHIPTRSCVAREAVFKRGDRPMSVHILLSGAACRYSLLANGHRQVTALLLPGDVVGFEPLMQWPCVDTVIAITHLQAAQVGARTLGMWIERRYGIAQALFQVEQLQAAICREWLLNVGKRSAVERVAHFFCETVARSRALGISNGLGCQLPLTQTELADIVAVTPVHVNRILMHLKRENLMSFVHGYAHILNLRALRALAGFDPAYLYPLQAADFADHPAHRYPDPSWPPARA